MDVPKRGVIGRKILFRKHLKGKKVLHIACADWPYTENQMSKGESLHQFMGKIALDLWGTDVVEEGILIMKKHGAKNVIKSDIYELHLDKNLLDKKFDVIVVSEVLEHLNNPGLALESIKKFILATNPKCEAIFTVPNRHNFWKNIVYALKKQECGHYDHRCYFTYRTFRTLIEEYDYEVEDFYFATHYGVPETIKGRIILKLFSLISPSMAPDLYFKCFLVKK